MRRFPFRLLVFSLAWLAILSGSVSAAPLRFFVVGDLPYQPAETPQLVRLFETAVAQKSPFLIHLGDIKGGGQPCTDASLQDIADLFRAQPVPVVYTPGDNEWTDCHRVSAGQYDPRERLARLREIFFSDPAVLRLQSLGVQMPDPAYPEIGAFLYGDVLFVALHVVGSDNGYRQGDAEAMAEFRQRDQANLALLHEAAIQARTQKARAMVLMFQANPLFHQRQSSAGFGALHRGLVQLMADYPGPVLLLHGDTHSVKHDRPLIDPGTGESFNRFVRAEVPGSPVVGGLWISVDPDAGEAFGVEEVYPDALDLPPR